MKFSPANGLARQLFSHFVFVTAVIPFALSLLLTACGGINASPQSSGSSAADAKITLSLAPTTINFGTVQLNSGAATSVVSVTNVGTFAETIESATIAPTSVFSIQGWTGAVTLNPGQKVQIRTIFAPKSAGNYSATLTLDAVMATPINNDSLPVNGSPALPLRPLSQVKIGVTGTASAAGGGPTTVAVSVSPSSLTMQSGQSKQFTSVVTGTSNVAVTWTAVLGSISSSGVYKAPTVTDQVVDTVSATSTTDPTKYASASVVIQSIGGTAAVWSIKNQQPVAQAFYPGSIFTTPLPADANTHCWNPSGSPQACSFADSSIAIVSNIFGGTEVNAGYTISQTAVASDSGGEGGGFYYSSESDPVYLITSNSNPCPPLSANCAAGKYFHLPKGAQWDSQSGDENIKIWDQSSDIDPTPGGRILTSYFFNSGAAAIRSVPTGCTATTPAQAAAQTACQISLYYNSVNYPFNDTYALDDSSDSAGFAGAAGFPREMEIENNTMNHALELGTYCLRSSSGNGTADAPVFPATGNVIGCSFVDSNRPLNGNLFWIDTEYNCGSLPTWQQPFCTAMQTYGGYIHDTGGSGDGTGLFVYPLEGGLAHTVGGVNDPMFNEPASTSSAAWIIANGNLTCPGGSYPKTCTGANGLEVVEDSPTSAEKIVWFLFNMPGLITGHHLHILDPCVAEYMAGQPGGCQ